MQERFDLSPRFWEDFRKNHWDPDRPAVLRGAIPPLMSGQEIIDALRTYRRRDGDAPKKLYTHHGPELVRSLPDWLPNEGEEIDTFTDRLVNQAGGHGFFLYIADFHSFASLDVWNRLCRVLNGFYSVIGVSTGVANTELFFGNYRKTAIGLHRDSTSLFSLVISGKKRIRFWSPHEFDDDPAFDTQYPGIMDYEQYLRRSFVLEAGPGDIIYGPASHWHIGEGDGDMSIAVSLTVDHFKNPSVSHQGLEKPNAKGASPECRTLLVDSETLRGKILAAPEDLGDLDRNYWMNRLTGFGFALQPRPDSAPAARQGHRICSSTDFPILFYDQAGRKPCREYNEAPEGLLVSANGQSMLFHEGQALHSALRRLNQGESVLVSEIPGGAAIWLFERLAIRFC